MIDLPKAIICDLALDWIRTPLAEFKSHFSNLYHRPMDLAILLIPVKFVLRALLSKLDFKKDF